MKNQTPKLSPYMMSLYRNSYRSLYIVDITGKQAYKEGIDLAEPLPMLLKYKHQQVPIEEDPETRVSTAIPTHLIERYHALYRSHFGIEIPWNTAVEEAERITGFMRLVAKHKTRSREEEVVH